MLFDIKILPLLINGGGKCKKNLRFYINQQSFMTTFERILSLNTSYLDLPRDGQILGPHQPSTFIPLSRSGKKQQKQYAKLQKIEQKLTAQIQDAQNQHQMMLQLFQSISKSEQQGFFLASKCHRRCSKDLVIRYHCPHQSCTKFYSAESALQRHIRTKHKTLGADPPQPYHELHPEPNLNQQIFEDSQESAFALSSPIPQKFEVPKSE